MNKLLRKVIINREFKDHSNKSFIISNFEEKLNEFYLEFSNSEMKVTNSNSITDQILANLEALFLHGLKETFISQLSTIIGNDVDQSVDINFWHFLLVLSPNGVIDQINSLKHVTTDVGKCRAWIRLTLNDCVFRSYLMLAFKYHQYIMKFYNKTAIICDQESFGKIISLLQGIEKYDFDLTLNSSLLNTWPNSTLVLAGYWTSALKNNPLYNPQVVEAICTNHIDQPIINDYNKSDESCTSSVSSSFVDTEFIHKPPVLYEDTVWDFIIKQPSMKVVKNDFISIRTLKDDISSSKIITIEPFSQKEDEQLLEKLTTEQNEAENSLEEECTSVVPMNNDQSFNDLLESYNFKVKIPMAVSVIEDLYKHSTAPSIIIERQYYNDAHVVDVNESFVDVSIHPEHMNLDVLKQYLKYLFKPPKEFGLNNQGYTCKNCDETIGIDFGNYFKCNFTACYYCINCFGTETWRIPVKILFDWDFNQYPVSNSGSTFLNEIQYHPLFNMKIFHRQLYRTNEMKKCKKLRWQIYFLFHYLSTCQFYNVEKLSKDLWPRVYFLNNIHLYSFADLQEIYSGTLFEFLERNIMIGREHVYQCVVCSQKGFVCEICRDPKIIYPFDLDNNYRCCHCKLIFHHKCYQDVESCPKCRRNNIRKAKNP